MLIPCYSHEYFTSHITTSFIIGIASVNDTAHQLFGTMSLFVTVLWTFLTISKAHAIFVNSWNSRSALEFDPQSALEYVASCASIQVDENDCIVGTFVNLVSQSANQDHGSVSTDEGTCGPPLINYGRLSTLFDTCQMVCMAPGSNLTTDQAQDSLSKISQILMAIDCWHAYCQEREQNQQDSLTLQNLKKGIAETVAPCSNITINLDSCLVSTSLTLILRNVTTEGSVGLSEAFHVVQNRSYWSSPMNEGDNISLEVPFVSAETIFHLTMQSSRMCGANDTQDDISEIQQTSAKLHELFIHPTCWSQNHDQNPLTQVDRPPDILVKLYLKQVLDCAGIEMDSGSCIENNLFGHWNSITADFPQHSRLSFLPTSSLYHQELGATCSGPIMSTTEMEQAVDRSKHICLAHGVSPTVTEIQIALQKLETLLWSESCWYSRCNPKILTTMKYKWMQKCSGVRLPASLVQPSSVMQKPKDDHMDSVFGCMIDFVVSSQPFSLGLFGFTPVSSNTCIPPILAQKNQFCSLDIGPKALSSCYEEPDELYYWEDLSMSYQYDDPFSLSYRYQHTSQDDFDEYSISHRSRHHKKRKGRKLINDLCVIVEAWSSDEGKQCFLDGCSIIGGNGDDKWLQPDKTPQPLSRPNAAPTFIPQTKAPFPNAYYRTDVPHFTTSTARASHQPTVAPLTKPDLPTEMVKVPTSVPFDTDYRRLTSKPSSSPSTGRTNEMTSNTPITWKSDKPTVKKPELPTERAKIPTNVPFNRDYQRLTSKPSSLPSTGRTNSRSNMPTTLKSNKPAASGNVFSPTRVPTKTPNTTVTKPYTNAPANFSKTRMPSRSTGFNEMSKQPIKVSSYRPSFDRRTFSPVIPPGKGTIAVSVQATISLSNLNETQVPAPGPERNNMVRVLEISIDQTLPFGAKCRVLRIGSIAVARRLLRELSEGLSVDFEVKITQTCEDASCLKSTSMAENLYNNVTSSLKDSVSTGEISKVINVIAASQNVTVLKNATLDTHSFVALSKQVTVVKSSIPSPIKNSSFNLYPVHLAVSIVSTVIFVAGLLLVG